MIIVQTPLRVSLFGGGTDFPEFYEKYGGCALTMAIDKYIYVIVKPRVDKKVRLTYTKAELVNDSIMLKHDIVREALQSVNIDHGIEVVTIGDVPAGTGLASSSAVTVGILKALHTYIGHEINAQDLATEACIIEQIILLKPVGIQDQHISAYGGFRFFQFKKNKIKVETINPGNLTEHLLLFFTGKTRSADTILKVQKENIKKNTEILKEMKKLSLKALKELKKGNYDNFGKLLDKNWQLKKLMATNISNSQIDRWYNRAKQAGALGGKILGAGGGGFLLLYCPEGTKDNVRKALSRLEEMPFNIEPDGSKVILNYRT